MKTLVLIPARYASSRLPGKPLKNQTGSPLIQHVYEQAKKAAVADEVIVATDDDRIKKVVQSFGGHCELTAADHESGSDRIAEVVRSIANEYDVIVNVQGDEPELDPRFIDLVANIQYKTIPFMATLACPFLDSPQQGNSSPLDPACVKVVLGQKIAYAKQSLEIRKAIYFSRSLIPYPRASQGKPEHYNAFFMHLGIYAYTSESLLEFTRLKKSHLESIEQLEQLRAIENDLSIHVGLVDHATPGIDTPEDYRGFVQRWRTTHNKSSHV